MPTGAKSVVNAGPPWSSFEPGVRTLMVDHWRDWQIGQLFDVMDNKDGKPHTVRVVNTDPARHLLYIEETRTL